MQYRTCLLILLVITLAMPTVAFGYDAVTLIAGGEKPFLHKQPLLINGTVYATLPALSTVGAGYVTDANSKSDGQKVEIKPASGEGFPVKAKLVDGELMIPLQEIAARLDADIEWNAATRTLILRSRIRNVWFDGSQLKVTTSYPVVSNVIWWAGGKKLILDMKGLRVPTSLADIPIMNCTAVPIRAGVQADGQTGRVVLDMPSVVKWKLTSPPKTAEIVVSVLGLQKPFLADVSAPATPTQTEVLPMDSAQPQMGALPVQIVKISHRTIGNRRIDVVVEADAPSKWETSLTRDPDELMLDLKHAVLDKPMDDTRVNHPLIKGIHAAQLGDNVRVTLDLNRIVGFDVTREGANTLTLSLILPKNAGGPLAGKTIVIDPGHGGSATGATGLDGSQEKASNLAIATRVRRLLFDAGVCAILTRAGDYGLDAKQKVDLEMRAACAQRHSADVFLSIHSNSVGGNKAPSGLETYYHGHDLSGKALAYCVHSEIVKAGLLPDLRVRSDTTLYQTGLGVLRNASEKYSVPAALIEVGYLNHPDDLAKITSPEFQQKIAEAVVSGFKQYFEGGGSAVKADTAPSITNGKAASGDDKAVPGGPKRPGE